MVKIEVHGLWKTEKIFLGGGWWEFNGTGVLLVVDAVK